MDISLSVDRAEQAKVQSQAELFNKSLHGGRESAQSLGRDDFLKILLTQLQNQDPTQPMEDKEFIAQMAQFSSLEQMTNIANGFQEMNALLGATQVLSILGKSVEVATEDGIQQGVVTAVTPGSVPVISIGNQEFQFSDIRRIVE